MPAAGARSVPADGRILQLAVLTALEVESAGVRPALRESHAEILLHQMGQGPANAAAAASYAIEAGARALMVFGLAGGLSASLAAGDIIVASAVTDAEGRQFVLDSEWRRRLFNLIAEAFPVVGGQLITLPAVLTRPEDKAAARQRYGADACDMESAAVAAVAAEAKVPLVVIRIIADAARDALPADVEQWVDEEGNSRLLPLCRAAVRPGQWRALGGLISRYRFLRPRLHSVARLMAGSDFGLTARRSGF